MISQMLLWAVVCQREFSFYLNKSTLRRCTLDLKIISLITYNLLHSDAEGDRNNFHDNAVRISHGNPRMPNQGLLEIRCQEQWGSVCLEGFGQVEADSACRQLGYSSAFSFTKS